MMNIKDILYEGTGIVPVKIELYESSGPVSPRYQFNTHILINNTNLNYKDEREFQGGKALNKTEFVKKLSNDQLEDILSEIINSNIAEQHKDFIGEKRKNVGVSFNYLELIIGGKLNIRIDYLLSDLKSDEFSGYNIILNIIKDLKKLNPPSFPPLIKGGGD
jgi:hypothetical protein